MACLPLVRGGRKNTSPVAAAGTGVNKPPLAGVPRTVRYFLAALVVAAPLSVAVASDAQAQDVTCQGRPATVVGPTEGAINTNGTEGDDVIVAPVGPYGTVQGLGGNDTHLPGERSPEHASPSRPCRSRPARATTPWSTRQSSTPDSLVVELGTGADHYVGADYPERVYGAWSSGPLRATPTDLIETRGGRRLITSGDAGGRDHDASRRAPAATASGSCGPLPVDPSTTVRSATSSCYLDELGRATSSSTTSPDERRIGARHRPLLDGRRHVLDACCPGERGLLRRLRRGRVDLASQRLRPGPGRTVPDHDRRRRRQRRASRTTCPPASTSVRATTPSRTGLSPRLRRARRLRRVPHQDGRRGLHGPRRHRVVRRPDSTNGLTVRGTDRAERVTASAVRPGPERPRRRPRVRLRGTGLPQVGGRPRQRPAQGLSATRASSSGADGVATCCVEATDPTRSWAARAGHGVRQAGPGSVCRRGAPQLRAALTRSSRIAACR